MAQSATRVSGYLTAPAGALFGGLIAMDIVLTFAVSGRRFCAQYDAALRARLRDRKILGGDCPLLWPDRWDCLFCGLFFFCAEVVRERPAALAVMIYFFEVASASLSLSAKTHGFSMFIVMVLVLLPRSRAQVVSEATSEPVEGQRAGRGRLQVA